MVTMRYLVVLGTSDLDGMLDVVEGPGGRQILAEDPAGSVVALFDPA